MQISLYIYVLPLHTIIAFFFYYIVNRPIFEKEKTIIKKL